MGDCPNIGSCSDFTPALCPELYGRRCELEIISLAPKPTARGQQARHIHGLNIRLTAGTEVISGLSTGGWRYCTRRMWRPASLTRGWKCRSRGPGPELWISQGHKVKIPAIIQGICAKCAVDRHLVSSCVLLLQMYKKQIKNTGGKFGNEKHI